MKYSLGFFPGGALLSVLTVMRVVMTETWNFSPQLQGPGSGGRRGMECLAGLSCCSTGFENLLHFLQRRVIPNAAAENVSQSCRECVSELHRGPVFPARLAWPPVEAEYV